MKNNITVNAFDIPFWSTWFLFAWLFILRLRVCGLVHA